jgi:hypothetical protein
LEVKSLTPADACKSTEGTKGTQIGLLEVEEMAVVGILGGWYRKTMVNDG